VITTIDEFQKIIETIEKNKNYQRPQAFGVGIATIDSKGNLLDSYFPVPNSQSNFATAAIIAKVVNYESGTKSFKIDLAQINEILSYFKPFENDNKSHPNIESLKQLKKLIQVETLKNKILVATFIAPSENDPGPQDISDAYLRLHLLSHRLIKPHGISMEGIFKMLPNVVWSSEGPIALDDLAELKMEAMLNNRALIIHSVDKFPRMTDYVVPTGVRIADASRVRLGAYLGEGTTVMHEGFINFNAGCAGPNMIEGRISAGVFVNKGTDVGGGASVMGTLSGGGNIVISIGEDCLLGANSGVGIPLGNRCTIEAGLYLTAGTKLIFEEKIIKAKELANMDEILFRRNSITGQVEAINKANIIKLNIMLHTP
jgi:2,3,4,5-tetrahydropyridine-2-carboxylate N-succinyltransferase